MGALHSQNSRSTLPTPLHQLHSTPPFIVHSVWESSTPQIPEVQLPVPHRPNEQAAAQFSPPNFSHFPAGPACKLSSPFLFPSLLPCVPARRPAPACPLDRAEACTGVPPIPRGGHHRRAPSRRASGWRRGGPRPRRGGSCSRLRRRAPCPRGAESRARQSLGVAPGAPRSGREARAPGLGERQR